MLKINNIVTNNNIPLKILFFILEFTTLVSILLLLFILVVSSFLGLSTFFVVCDFAGVFLGSFFISVGFTSTSFLGLPTFFVVCVFTGVFLGSFFISVDFTSTSFFGLPTFFVLSLLSFITSFLYKFII